MNSSTFCINTLQHVLNAFRQHTTTSGILGARSRTKGERGIDLLLIGDVWGKQELFERLHGLCHGRLLIESFQRN